MEEAGESTCPLLCPEQMESSVFPPVWGSVVPTQSWFCVACAGRAASVCFTFSMQSVWLNICCLCDSSARHLPGKANQHNPSCRWWLEQTGASGRFWDDAGALPAPNPNFQAVPQYSVNQCPVGFANQFQSGGEQLKESRRRTHECYVKDLPLHGLWAYWGFELIYCSHCQCPRKFVHVKVTHVPVVMEPHYCEGIQPATVPGCLLLPPIYCTFIIWHCVVEHIFFIDVLTGKRQLFLAHDLEN